MRHSARAIYVTFTMIAIVLCASASTARADDRAQARAHFQAGLKAYGGGDFRGALTEFDAAQRLSPADLNYYNIALCHDKLGEAEPAIQNYREYLRRAPEAPKRAEIEASIARLDDALRSATRKAEEEKRAEDAKRAEEVRRAEEQRRPPPGAPPESAAPPAPIAYGAGSSGTPSTGLTVATGDAQLDRVAAINVDAVRDQRSFTNRPAEGPSGPAGTAPAPAGDAPPKARPIYTKWWFWAIVAVGAVVVYEVATAPSNSTTQVQGREQPRTGGVPEPAMALFRF